MLRFGQPSAPKRTKVGLPYSKLILLLVVLVVALSQLILHFTGAGSDERRKQTEISVKRPDEASADEKSAGRLLLAAGVTSDEDEPREERKRFLSEFERLTLEAVEDQRMPLETEPFMFVLRKVASADADELESYVDSRVTYDNFAIAPQRCRGYVVRFRGTLMRARKSSIDVSDAGLDQVWEGQVVDKNYHWYSYYVVDEPTGFRTRDDVVELVGVFHKNIVYETQALTLKATPLIIAKRLKRYTPPRRQSSGPSAVTRLWRQCEEHPVMGGTLVAAVLGLICLLWILHRREQALARARTMPPASAELDVEIEYDE